MVIMRTFILQFYLGTLFMIKVGECYLSNIVRSTIFHEKSALYLIKYCNWLNKLVLLYNRLEIIARDKHCSLLDPFVIYKKMQCCEYAPRFDIHKITIELLIGTIFTTLYLL
jgi:hypothetical protein